MSVRQRNEDLGGDAHGIMTIQEWGALGELVGGVAVIVTLIYLAVQTRQTRRAAAAHAPEWISDGFQRWLLSLRQDSDFTRIFRSALHDWNALPANDQARVHYVCAEMIIHLDAVLTLHKQGLLGDEHARAWVDNSLGLLITPGGKAWFSDTRFLYSPQVRGELERRLQEPASLPPAWTTIPFYQLDEYDSDRATKDQGAA